MDRECNGQGTRSRGSDGEEYRILNKGIEYRTIEEYRIIDRIESFEGSMNREQRQEGNIQYRNGRLNGK
jgi:hypothetical protein